MSKHNLFQCVKECQHDQRDTQLGDEILGIVLNACQVIEGLRPVVIRAVYCSYLMQIVRIAIPMTPRSLAPLEVSHIISSTLYFEATISISSTGGRDEIHTTKGQSESPAPSDLRRRSRCSMHQLIVIGFPLEVL